MKSKLLIAVILFLAINITGQSKKNYIFSIGDTELGVYIGTGGRFTSLNSDLAGFLDFKGAVIINGEWAIGLAGSALNYDKKLSELTTDGTYHLYAGYGGIFVERIFSVNSDFKISVSILSGQGEAYYQYDKDYRKEKTWSEETIDKTIFYVFEPGIEIQHRVAGNFWLGITGSYRNTSPLQLMNVTENLFRKFSGGVSFKWGIF